MWTRARTKFGWNGVSAASSACIQRSPLRRLFLSWAYIDERLLQNGFEARTEGDEVIEHHRFLNKCTYPNRNGPQPIARRVGRGEDNDWHRVQRDVHAVFEQHVDAVPSWQIQIKDN